MPRHLLQRRVVLQSLASAAALLAIPHFSHGQAVAEETTPDEAHEPNDAGGATATPKLAVLTVVVTGDDEPVGEAEVTVTFPRPSAAKRNSAPTPAAKRRSNRVSPESPRCA